MGEWAERAIEEEMFGPRCLDCDETPCMCDDNGFDDEDDCCECGVPLCGDCLGCPACGDCDCADEDED